MKMKQRNSFLSVAALALGSLLLAGCSSKVDDLELQSKFTYPNGDYAAIGHAHAEMQSITFFTAPIMTREVFQTLHQQALTQNGGADDLVDYIVSAKTTSLLFATQTTFSLDGTAIKITNLGGQIYNNAPSRAKP